MDDRSGWLGISTSTGPDGGQLPTGCSAREPKPMTPSKAPGSASAAPVQAGGVGRARRPDGMGLANGS